MGIQSPYLAGGIVRLGRFFYLTTGVWLGGVWYSAYVNERTPPGSGPRLILPGKKVISGPDRADKTPPFAAALQSSASVVAAGGNLVGDVVGAITGGPARVNLARIANAYVRRGNFRYSETRPYPNSLNSNPCATDCSGFVILCYKMAGLPDPNGTNYNGSGFTGSLIQQGVSVPRPNIGDLAFWQNPDHVALVTATGSDPQIVEFGGPPSPMGSTISRENPYHSRFLGYRSYI